MRDAVAKGLHRYDARRRLTCLSALLRYGLGIFETEWPIVFQTAEGLLIFAVKLRNKNESNSADRSLIR